MRYFVTLLREAHKLEVPFVLEQKFRLVGFSFGVPAMNGDLLWIALGAFGWFMGLRQRAIFIVMNLEVISPRGGPQVYIASCAHGVAVHVGVDVSKQANGSAKARSEHVHVCTDVPVAHSIYSFYLGYLVVPSQEFLGTENGQSRYRAFLTPLFDN